MADAKKKKPEIASASIITSILAVVIPFLLQNVAFYFQTTKILAFAGGLGISLGVLGALLGVSALVVIIKNKVSFGGYAYAILGIVLGAWSSYAWFGYLTWLIYFQKK